ncbi:hypothetical protein DIPPA_10359 [Diplonema papillatum]|nr:hypothetical protein DIPPA_10359 [Diplonema papillatum]
MYNDDDVVSRESVDEILDSQLQKMEIDRGRDGGGGAGGVWRGADPGTYAGAEHLGSPPPSYPGLHTAPQTPRTPGAHRKSSLSSTPHNPPSYAAAPGRTALPPGYSLSPPYTERVVSVPRSVSVPGVTEPFNQVATPTRNRASYGFQLPPPGHSSYADQVSPVFSPKGITAPVYSAGDFKQEQAREFACHACSTPCGLGDRFCRSCGAKAPAEAPRAPSRERSATPEDHSPQWPRDRSASGVREQASPSPHRTVPFGYNVPVEAGGDSDVSVLDMAMHVEQTHPRLRKVVEGSNGAILEMPNDNVPVIPRDADEDTRSSVWRHHPSSIVVSSLLALRGRGPSTHPEIVDRHMTRPFLDALARMMTGAYFLRYSRDGPPRERWCVIAMLLGLDKTMGALPYFCWASHAQSHTFRERLCLSDLIGVQRDATASGFQPSLINPKYIYCLSSANRRQPISAQNCFTLWFQTGKGPHAVNLLNQHDEVYRTWVHALEVIRSINTGDRNWTRSAYKNQSHQHAYVVQAQRVASTPLGGRSTSASPPRFRNRPG